MSEKITDKEFKEQFAFLLKNAKENAKESKKADPDSYGAGYDAGYLKGLEHLNEFVKMISIVKKES